MKNPAIHVDFARLLPHRLRASGISAQRRSIRKPRVVLFALFERGRPTQCLLRAFTFAGLIGAELHVLRVLPELSRLDRPSSRDEFAATQSADRAMRAVGSTRSWLRDVLGKDAAALTHITPAHGDFIEQVARHAKRVDAALIVTPAREASIGAAATSLACKCNAPVLVARAAKRDQTIVAATDLQSPGYPVLRMAVALGRQLKAPLVTLHNVEPVAAVFGMDANWFLAGLSVGAARRARAPELAEVSAKLHAGALAVVRREQDLVAAILNESRARDADIVVVGARRRSWLERLRVESVATQVVDRAQRSVLVTPLHGTCSFAA